MILFLKHILGSLAIAAAAVLYGYTSAQTGSDWLTACAAGMYTISLVLIYIYIYDTTPRSIKILGVIFTAISSVLALYLAWAVWVTIRSDNQLYLFYTPLSLWQEVLTMAANANNKLVHLRYPALDETSSRLYIYWILEAISTILLPILFSIRSITSYSDKNISAQELHERFSSPTN